MADVFNRSGKGIAKDFTATLSGLASNNPALGIGETIVARVGAIYRKKTNAGTDSANWNDLDFDPESLTYVSISAMKSAEAEILSSRDKIFIDGSQGGQFYYDPDDTTTSEDGWIVFVTTGGKRIKRQYEQVKLSYFGENQAALTLLAGISTELTVIVDKNFNCTAATTIPANISLEFKKGGSFTQSGAGDLTINGTCNDARHQIFYNFTTSTLTLDKNTFWWLRPEHFGAYPNNGDCLTELQLCIDIAAASCRNVFLSKSGGAIRTGYEISSSLFIGRGEGFYTNVTIFGNVSSVTVSGQFAPEIYCTALDKPAVIVQGARGVRLKDFIVTGDNLAPSFSGYIYAEDEISKNVADWITSGCTSGRWNVQSGIAIDPLNGTDPGSGYPFTYGRLSSNDVQLENIAIRNFVAGLSVGGPADENSDVCDYNVKVSNCAYGYISSGLQNKANVLINSAFFGIHTTFNTKDFFLQLGKMPNIEGRLNIGGTYQIFDLNGHTETNVSGIYTESLGRIGKLTNTYTSAFHRHHKISKSFFQFNDFNNYTPASIIDQSVNLTFQGCTLNSGKAFYNFGQHRNLSFVGCVLKAGFDFKKNLIAINRSFHEGINFVNTVASNGTEEWDLSEKLDKQGFSTSLGRVNIYTPATRTLKTQDKTYCIEFNNLVSTDTHPFVFTVGGMSYAISGSGKGAIFTFTVNANYIDQPLVGDIYLWLNNSGSWEPALRVTAINTGTNQITLEALCDDLNESAGLTTSMYLVINRFVSLKGNKGDFTLASKTVTNVTNISDLLVGDMIFTDTPAARKRTAGGVSSLVSYRITAINTGTNEITLNRNAAASEVGASFYNSKFRDINAVQFTPLQFVFASNYFSEILCHEAMILDCSQGDIDLIKALGGTFVIKKYASSSYSIVTSATESFAKGNRVRVELTGATFDPETEGNEVAVLTIKRIS